MGGILDSIAKDLEGEFGTRLEKATAATEDLRRVDEKLLTEIQGLREDIQGLRDDLQDSG